MLQLFVYCSISWTGQQATSEFKPFLTKSRNYIQPSRDLTSWSQAYLKQSKVQTIDTLRDFSLDKPQTYLLLVEIGKAMTSRDLNHDPDRTLAQTAELIRATSNSVLKKWMNEHQVKVEGTILANLEYFATFYGVENWMETHVEYSDDLAKKVEQGGKLPDFDQIMSDREPATVCGGLTWGVVKLTALAGQEHVYKIEGGERMGTNGSHSWVIAKMPGGAWIFADPTRGCMPLAEARKRAGNTFHPYSTPIEDWCQGLYLYNYHNGCAAIAAKRNGNIVQPNFVFSGRTQSGELTPDQSIDILTKQSWRAWQNVPQPLNWRAFNNSCHLPANER